MSKHITVSIESGIFVDFDDCLAAAAEAVGEEYGCLDYDMSPRWQGGDEGNRTRIDIDVPSDLLSRVLRDHSLRVESETYVVSASYEHDGMILDCSQAECLGGAFGVRYASREAAKESADELSATLDETDLDPSTTYSVAVAS